MTETELKQYLQTHYPKETTLCEWKEFKSLTHFVKGHEGDDIISYISAISNMEGGQLVIDGEDATLINPEFKDNNSYTRPYNRNLKQDFVIETVTIKKSHNKVGLVLHKYVHLQQHAYPASHKNSALRVSVLFLYT